VKVKNIHSQPFFHTGISKLLPWKGRWLPQGDRGVVLPSANAPPQQTRYPHSHSNIVLISPHSPCRVLYLISRKGVFMSLPRMDKTFSMQGKSSVHAGTEFCPCRDRVLSMQRQSFVHAGAVVILNVRTNEMQHKALGEMGCRHKLILLCEWGYLVYMGGAFAGMELPLRLPAGATSHSRG
jgi:hypothetical protein